MESSEAQQRLEQALRLHEHGQSEAAVSALRGLIAEGARLPKAAMALGILCGESGDRQERRVWLLHALQLEEAEGPKPPSLRLLLNLLVDALEQGEPERALAIGQEALVHYPNDGELHLQLARSCSALDRPEDALSHLDRACAGLRAQLAEDPENAKAWRLLAIAEKNAQRLDSSIEAYGGALALDPNHLPSLLAISRLLIERGQIDQAMPWLMNALALSPDDPDVLSLNGCALKALGEAQQAVDLFHQALKLQPGHLEASLFLGSCLCEQGLFAESAKVFRAALDVAPGHLECRSGLAAALRSLGDVAGALTIYRELLEEVPHAQGAFNNWMFTTSISQLVPPQEVLRTAGRFWQAQGVDPVAPKPVPLPARMVGRPLRVGVLSADVGSHVVGRFLEPLLRHHDPRRCQLELISMQRRYESSTEELINLADGFHSLEGLPLLQARDHLRNQGYDLILDTSGYTRGTGIQLLAERCAPVQAHYIGYHATTGLATIDWFIGDEETAAPDLQEQFCEQLYRLPQPWLAYPKDPSFPEATPLMETDRPVFGCFGQLGKISTATMEFWGAVLRLVPEALLVLKDRGLQEETVRTRLERDLAQHGIEGWRLRFLAPVTEWHDHVDLYNIIDIALDTTPWSSATTGFEALAMGVPLLAIRGKSMASRMSSSLVKTLGRSDWVIGAKEDLAEILQPLLSDLESLRQKKKERQQIVLSSSLFDGLAQAEKFMKLVEAIC